jgi:Peptidase family M23
MTTISAETAPDAARLEQLLGNPRPEGFTPGLLKKVNFEEIRAELERLRGQYGDVQKVLPSGERHFWNVRAQRGSYEVEATFAQGQIQGLRVPSKPPDSLWMKVNFLVLWLLPLALLSFVIAAWKQTTRLDWLVSAVPSLVFGAAILGTSVWAQSSTWLSPLYWLGLAALLASAVRLPGLPPGRVGGWNLLFVAALLLVFIPQLLGALRGRQAPPDLAALGPVLAGGRFMVGQGGSTPTLNYHMAHRHMRYAADFIGVGPFGRHASGLLPADPARYAIFGAQVLAPLDGEVIASRNDLPDLSVPHSDSLRPTGNFVLLRATSPDGREVRVLLAHLQQGSVMVQAGMRVRAGQIIGRVGNSGNTTEPHLHLGVSVGDGTVGGELNDPLSGEGVPFSVAGRFPVRGMGFVRSK